MNRVERNEMRASIYEVHAEDFGSVTKGENPTFMQLLSAKTESKSYNAAKGRAKD